MSSAIVKLLNPWRARREEMQQRIDELRKRDGDTCRRCRRAMQFDLPAGHDSAPAVIDLGADATSLENLCLCHTRCNAETVDNTVEVQERMKLRFEAEAAAERRKAAKRPRKRAA
jgi:hypothetical protein